jgi:hypothetical protein
MFESFLSVFTLVCLGRKVCGSEVYLKRSICNIACYAHTVCFDAVNST